MNYYERHIGDYLKDTAHLSLLEHGIYTRLLDVYYTKEVGIEEGMAARLIGARSKDELAALNTVLMEFFTLEAGVYTQRRCDREIENYQKRAEHNRRVGKLGGRPRKVETQTEPTENPPGYLREPEPNPPSSQKPVANTEANASVVAAKPRPSRKCPESFSVDAELRRWAGTEAPSVDLDRETAKFRDHTFKTALTDWAGAWRNWVRRASEGGRSAVIPINRQEAIEQRNRQVGDRWLAEQEDFHASK